MPLRRSLATTVAVLPLLALAACGSSSSSKTSTTPTTGGATSAAASATAGTSAAAAEVPAAIKSKGTLTVASDATYAPNEFLQGTTVIGMDADLAAAIGQQLGLKVTVTNQTFDGIIPGLAAGRYDLGMSSFTDTKKREATVDMVDYFSAGTSFFIKTGGTAVKTLDDLCGLTVSVEKGTTQQDDATAQSKKCTTAGKKAVTVSVFDKQTDANLALSSGRAQVSMADSPVAAYQVQQSKGAFALSGDAYGTAPYGIAIPKGNGMAQAVKDALTTLVSNGQYAQILGKWGVQAGAVSTITINGATS